MKTRIPLLDAEAKTLRAKLAATAKHSPENIAEIDTLRRRLKVNRTAAYLADVLAEPPLLTTDERTRLMSMLAGQP